MRIAPDRPLVLGSASARRRELLGSIGVPLVVVPAEIDEGSRRDERPQSYLERIVDSKLGAVCKLLEADGRSEAPVLVADTVVVDREGAILGKPADDTDAKRIMMRLSGAVHEVRTRFRLATAGPRIEGLAKTVTTRVTFRALTPAEVEAYVSSGEGRDKAGAYAIQGRAAAFVESVEGSYTSVVGLPLAEVVTALRDLGWWGPR